MTHPAPTPEARERALQLLSLDIRIIDTGDWSRAGALFTDDAVFALPGVAPSLDSAGGGLADYRAFVATRPRTSHHLVNSVIETATTAEGRPALAAWSRLLAVFDDATAGSFDVLDLLPLGQDGLPVGISVRRITPRLPAAAYDGEHGTELPREDFASFVRFRSGGAKPHGTEAALAGAGANS